MSQEYRRMHQHRRTSDGVIVFDGDDTLWDTQELYDSAKSQFYALLKDLGFDLASTAAKFAEIDIANVARFGFSRERFPTSMCETYEALCSESRQTPQADMAAKATSIGETVFNNTPPIRPDAKHVLEMLRSYYRLVLFTAGDASVQQTRIEQSGLAAYFQVVRITPKKTPESWKHLIEEQNAAAATTWSIGNSVRSDINPALQLGMRCVVIAGRTWEYEHTTMTNELGGARVWHASNLTKAAKIVLEQHERPVDLVTTAIRRGS